MSVSEPGKDVNLRIESISRSMVGNIPDLLIDLLEIAAYVYCADQRIKRGTEMLMDYGKDWCRSLTFSIPVRHPEVWTREEVQQLLVDTLGFLSDDSYTFRFRKAEAPVQPRDPYFHELLDAFQENDEVALFSGGVDSFAGAVNDIVTLGKSVTLVGHWSVPKVQNVQATLVDALKQRGYGRRLSYVPVWVSNTDIKPAEYTQRTRSFLFACIGLVVARMSGKDCFSFYENGVVSINPPLAGDVVGGRATRTTHPKVLRGLEDLFSTLLDRQIEIRTPLQWLTKKEVTETIAAAGMADMIGSTVSCTRTHSRTRRHTHCGICSQCIDRRFAVLAAGLADHDPADQYKKDLLLSDRSADDSLRMAMHYVSFFRKVGSITKDRFLVDLPEIVSALDHFPDLSADEASAHLFDLFQRHARSVEDVIARAGSEHAGPLFRGEVPAGSLLATCFTRDHVEIAPKSGYDQQTTDFVDRLSTPILEFAVDHDAEQVLFHGGHRLEGANYRFVSALIENFRNAKRTRSEIPFMPPHDVADEIGVSEQSMRQQLRRLRDSLDPLAVMLGIPLDQNSFIETKERAGYRINPGCREISLGDIQLPNPSASPE
ncbi:7-cyano-7-deazaguanine synthase [Rhodovulum sp.]|uniref:7-cyano-7-deazaguanine synthase n=1 Tax=Rhodovulum sp. TaxID=34009 RepID=UPI00257E04ED|nr:7-cyano-7-deazaguanine synthase [Rhodovulum sp.]